MCSLLALALFTVPASAQDTRGGNGGQGNVIGSPIGGTSSLTGTGGNGSGTSESYEGAAGGGAGAIGGNGGAASNGGAGGAGGAAPGAAGGDGVGGGGMGSRASGGGGGAHGAVLVSPGSSVAPAIGGSGGAGGDSGDGDGGGGGAGGYGTVIDTSGPVVLNHAVSGGNGGSGGDGYFYGGGGGDGGYGLAFTGSSTVTVNAAVTGGNGGQAGGFLAGGCCASGANGSGGIGIVGSNVTLSLNAGVSGGLSGDGVTRAVAVQLGGSSHLTLGPGWSILGGVVVNSGGNIDFDQASNVTLSNTISGAGSISKSGAGTLTLTGSNSYTGGTSFYGGVISVSGNSNLGAASGGLTFNGGTLATTATFNTGRAVALSGTGTLDVATGTELGLTGTVSGSGNLTKSGAGTLRLSGNNIYTGGTTINAGTLAVSSDGNLGNASGGLTFGGGTLATTASFNSGRGVTLSGAGTLNVSTGTELGLTGTIAGSGTLTKSGAGLLRLSGSSTYSGGTTINAGTLAVSSDSNLGAASGGLAFNGGKLVTTGSFTSGRAVTLSSTGDVDVAASTEVGLTGAVTGAGDLVKRGAGTLTLGGSNTYSGGTTINAGILSVSSDSNLGAASGGLTLNGGTLATTGSFTSGRAVSLAASGGINVSANTELGLNGTVAGAAGLTKSGAGTLRLGGNNTYTGGTTINAGTLAVSGDGNLGAASGDITLNGGTLATTASFDTARAVTLTSGGAISVGANTELGLTAAVTGGGDLTKRGAGTLRLDNGANAYGNTLVEAGILIGNTATISGSIGNAATIIFDQAADGSFAGGIGSLSGVGGAMVKRGAGNLTLTGQSSLDWSIEAGQLTTAADRFGGDSFIGANATLLFDQSNDAGYGGVLTGSGAFVKSGAGTLAMDGNSAAYAGTTTVNAGRLIVGFDLAHSGASLGGSVDVGNGATLGGHGTIGSGNGSSVTIGAGGTVAPGNSIGTLTVRGSFVQAAGSTYVAEIGADGSSDWIRVRGTATLNGGTVYVGKGAGFYRPGGRFTLLTADAGLTGRYSTLVQNMPFVDLALAYDASNVFLDVARNDVSFSSAGITRNQIATAVALESLGDGNTLYNAIAGLPDTGSARTAFEALSGEAHASVKSRLVDDSHFVRDAAINRLRTGYGETTGSGIVTPGTAEGSGMASWAQAFGGWGSYEGDGNAADMDSTTGGFVAGLDGEVGQIARLGVLAGYSRTTFHIDDRASSGSSDNYHLGLYGGDTWDALRLSGGLAYTWHDIDTRRSAAFPGFADSLSGTYDAGTFQAFGEAGYQIDMSSGLFLEPFANLAYVNLRTNGFAEEGGIAALSGGSSTTDATFAMLGVNVGSAFDLGGLNASAHGRLGWRHAFGDIAPESTLSFAGSDAFAVSGVPIVRDILLVEAGLDLDLSDASRLGIAYQGEFGNGALQNGIKANFSVKF